MPGLHRVVGTPCWLETYESMIDAWAEFYEMQSGIVPNMRTSRRIKYMQSLSIWTVLHNSRVRPIVMYVKCEETMILPDTRMISPHD